MKYALIVMLAVYLLTFGCNPKTEEEKTEGHDKIEHVVVTESPIAPVQVTVETKAAVQTTPEAGPGNQLKTGTQKAPAPPTNVHIKIGPETVMNSLVPETQTAAQAAEKVITTEPTATDDANNQWEKIAQSAASTVLALMKNEGKEPVDPANVEEASVTNEEVDEHAQVAVEPAKDKTAVLPCGIERTQDSAAQHPPCIKHCATGAKPPAAPTEDAELSEAMQKMVNATNNMVTVTRQLVIATQQMLTASKEVAVEVIDTGKETIETSKPAVQNTVNEKEIIETVKEVVSATIEAFEATSESLSNALEAKEAQPVPEATPQQ